MKWTVISIKQSKFNIYYTADDGVKLAFNSLSCGLAVVDQSYYKLMDNLKGLSDENVPDDLREVYLAAKEGNFIVEDNFDELLDLLTKRYFQKFSVESLGLTIAPTMECNFKCTYCYETSKIGMMDKLVLNNIVQFVENQAEHLKNLSISWYGGEPLLGIKSIYELSEKFIEICGRKNINYEAFIISNGALLSDEIIEQLIKYKVYGIQITLDGPPDVHDARRINKSGESTFDAILNNINKVLLTHKMDVILRINVDKLNEDSIENLIEILDGQLINKHIKITFGQVTAYTEACRSIESSCFSNDDFAVNLLRYYKILKKYGFDEYNEFPYPEAKLNYCCAELLNSFVIDHEGYLYKCWNEVGNLANSIGNILDINFDITGYKNGKWINQNPFSSEKCTNCKLIPVCMGGCPYSRIVLGQGNECDLIKYNIKDIMLNYYNTFKEEML